MTAMTRPECAKIVAALSSANLLWMDEATHEVWFSALADLNAADVGEVVGRMIRTRTADQKVAPGDVRADVRRLRHERLASTLVPLPAHDPDDVAGYLAEYRANITATADGAEHAEPVLPRRPVQALIAGAFRGVR